MRLKLAALLLLLLVGLGAGAYALLGLGTPRASSAQYLTAQATREDVVDEVVATGSVSASASYALAFGSAPVESSGSASTSSSSSSSASSTSASAAVSWTVATVGVAVGDRVTKGQRLATAKSSDLLAQLANAQRAVASAKVQLAIAQTSLDDASTTAAIRQAKVGLWGTETQLADAMQQEADLEAMGRWAALTAPAEGVVTSVAIEAGTVAPSSEAIVVQAAQLQVTGNVVEADVTAIKPGQTATVAIEALGVDLPGTVSAIAPSAAASNGSSIVTFAVTVTLTNPPDAARVGMSAQLSIAVAQSANALAVPAAAIAGSAGAYDVRVLGADGAVETRPVSVGLITSSLAEITAGLSEGETVITGTATQRTTTGAGGGLGVGLGGGGFRTPGGQP
jgi:macrolide-specific efflux system membrane fusion protein